MITCGGAEPECFRPNQCIQGATIPACKQTRLQTASDDEQSSISGSSGIGSLTTTLTTTKESEQLSETGITISETSSTHGKPKTKQKKTEHQGIHEICQACLINAPEDESLIVDSCHSSHLHDGNYPLVCTAWDEDQRLLVQIRPLPQMAIIRGFAICNGKPGWCRGDKCTFAHGPIEKSAWNWEINRITRNVGGTRRGCVVPKSTGLLPNPLLPHYHARVPRPAIPNCYSQDPQQFVRFTVNRRDNYSEFNKWKTKFTGRLQRTKLTDDDLEPKLSVDNYQEKFYYLLCFEELEHINLLTKKCDESYEFEFLSHEEAQRLKCLPYENIENVGVLKGMSGNQIAYATQSSEGLFFVKFGNDNEASKTDICKAQILSCNFSKIEKHLYISLRKKDAIELKKHMNSSCPSICHIEFEVKHGFFDTLHKAVVNIPPSVIRKIMPNDKAQFPLNSNSSLTDSTRHKWFQLAKGPQLSALNAILSALHFASPVLISGPFGSGKTRILARAAYELMKRSVQVQKNTRILICAHHPASTQTYINDYFGKLPQEELRNAKILRITRGTFQKDSPFNSFFSNLSEFQKAVSQGQYVNEKCLVLVTTYMTSIQLLSIIKEDNWFFTHVFLDEAAQVREPEAIASLCLAGKETKIVIAGDSKQVGPALVVLGQQAHENGLGISLLERLEKKYEEIGDRASPYYCILSDNYRCTRKITEFLSKLFYDGKAHNRISVPLHPKLNLCPFVFFCCDIEPCERLIRAPQEDTFEAEADAIIKQLNFYYGTPLRTKKFPYANTDKISVITPNRNQGNLIRQKLKGNFRKVNVLPTYMIQGHEFESVFLSTSEPLEPANLQSQDPQKSLCNPHVFNTAISRAKSLVVAVGNPFKLLMVEEAMGSRRRCWKEYITFCLSEGKIFFPLKYRAAAADYIKRIASAVSNCSGSNSKSAFTTDLSLHKSELESKPASTPRSQPLIPPPPPPPLPTSIHLPKGISYAAALKSGTFETMEKLAVQRQKPQQVQKKQYTEASPPDSDTEEKAEGRDELLKRFMESFKRTDCSSTQL